MNAAERGTADRPAAGWSARARAVLVPLTMLVLAGILLANPLRYARPYPPAQVVPASATDTTPVRHPRLRPEAQIGGRVARCSECHKLLTLPPETGHATLTSTRPTGEHADIELKHGINTRCYNCHNPADLDTFVDDWGRAIPYDQPPLICAKCHGPVYRDWLHGSHGRVNGYWNPKQAPATVAAPQTRRKCIECHDPHAPPFAPMHPAPAPQTLRMGDQRLYDKHGGVRDPLRVFRQPPVSETNGQH